jgi:hypothetical protein
VYSSASSRTLMILAFAVTIVATPASAQKLVPRPPSAAQPPSATAAPSNVVLPAAKELIVPRGTSLQVEIARAHPMKKGIIEGQLLHPIYIQGKLAVPKDTLVVGNVVALEPDMKTRWHGRLQGDFTPFDTAQVRFNEIVLPTGPLPITAGTAAAGAPLLQLTAPGARPKESLVAREWTQAKARVRERVDWFIAPGFGDRALQMLYHQLPYHPQRIEAHTAWSFELSAPLDLPGLPPTPALSSFSVAGPKRPETWTVPAVLTQELTSARAKPGDPVEALVVEPVFDRDKQLVVPQGSMLIGKVTTAKAARSLGRNGKLRFIFQQVRFPEGFGKPVVGAVAGATAEKAQDLQMDAEGTITPRNQSSAIAPLLLTMLASRALDEDGNITADTGVASNGFGILGRIVGLAAGDRNLAAGLGYYAAGLSLYENFLRPGRDVVFAKDTRIEIETTPLRAPVLKPNVQ